MKTTIFYDVDTQNDFMNKDGALYVPGAEEIKPVLAKITAYALKHNYPIVGSVDKHNEFELKTNPEFLPPEKGGQGFPPHCMKGTYGQKKIAETGLECPTFIERPSCAWHYADSAANMVKHYVKRRWEVYFEKQNYDVFTNGQFQHCLEECGVERAIVYGVATDYCVKAAAVGMARMGIEVYVLTDAIKAVSPKTEAKAFKEMKKAGVKFTEFSDLEKILG